MRDLCVLQASNVKAKLGVDPMQVAHLDRGEHIVDGALPAVVSRVGFPIMYRRIVLALALSLVPAGQASAVLIINVNQVGSDVVFEADGSLNILFLSRIDFANLGSFG